MIVINGGAQLTAKDIKIPVSVEILSGSQTDDIQTETGFKVSTKYIFMKILFYKSVSEQKMSCPLLAMNRH